MNRRGFLKTLLGAAAHRAVAPVASLISTQPEIQSVVPTLDYYSIPWPVNKRNWPYGSVFVDGELRGSFGSDGVFFEEVQHG